MTFVRRRDVGHVVPIRVHDHHWFPAVDAHDSVDAQLRSGFLPDLSDDGVARFLSRLYGAADQAPESGMGVARQQKLVTASNYSCDAGKKKEIVADPLAD